MLFRRDLHFQGNACNQQRGVVELQKAAAVGRSSGIAGSLSELMAACMPMAKGLASFRRM